MSKSFIIQINFLVHHVVSKVLKNTRPCDLRCLLEGVIKKLVISFGTFIVAEKKLQ